MPNITVIIPTTAETRRGESLQRCIGSIRKGSKEPISIIAVVNGNRADRSLVQWLKEQSDVTTVEQALGSAPHAVLTGREMTVTPFFATLDDDDEILEGGLDARLAAIETAEAELLVTNSYFRRGDAQKLIYADLHSVESDPLMRILEQNWLNSGNALYRTSAVGPEYFRNPHGHVEWTWLGFKLSRAGIKVRVLDRPTNIINRTERSLSQSAEYLAAHVPLFERMLAEPLSITARRMVRRKMSATYHEMSELALVRGELSAAVAYHARSLLLPGGLRYLSYSRRLLKRPSDRRTIAPNR